MPEQFQKAVRSRACLAPTLPSAPQRTADTEAYRSACQATQDAPKNDLNHIYPPLGISAKGVRNFLDLKED